MASTLLSSISPARLPRERWAAVRHALPSDAGGIGAVYDDAYGGTYTYTEFTDPGFVRGEIERHLAQWYVIEDTTGDTGAEIAGCISGHMNVAARRVYIRGMMLRTGWQGRGGTSALFGDVFHDFIHHHGGSFDIYHSETRAADPKPQAICEAVGLNPLAVLPGKDVFHGRRETPVVMAAYASTAWKQRAGGVSLIPEVVPVRDAVAALHRPMRKDTWSRADIEPVMPPRPSGTIDIGRFPKRHGYETFAFTCEKTGESVTVDVHRPNANAEHLSTWCASPATAAVLLSFARRYLEAQGVHHVEGTCPATKPGLQRAWVDAGFHPMGYLPAWEVDRSGERVDHVLFGKGRGSIDGACLSAKATTIAVATGAA